MRIVSPFCNSLATPWLPELGQKDDCLDSSQQAIIIPVPLRWCWNWQTGMVEGHVPQGVWVQLPPSALNRRKAVCFFAEGESE